MARWDWASIDLYVLPIYLKEKVPLGRKKKKYDIEVDNLGSLFLPLNPLPKKQSAEKIMEFLRGWGTPLTKDFIWFIAVVMG